jgi:SAM-dependent methyltransferase
MTISPRVAAVPVPDAAKSLDCDLCGANQAEILAVKHDLPYLRCTQCGFVYSDSTEFDFAAFNKDIIEDLRDVHVGKLVSRRHSKAYAALLKEFEPYRKTGRLLEIGCSTGSFLSHARSARWQEFGVEPVESSARHGIEQLGLNIHVGTLETAACEANSFDVAYSNAVIEHLQHPADVINEAFKVLRPGGLFYADTVNLDSYTWRFLGPRWKLFDPRMHLSLFTPDTLRAYCETNSTVGKSS